MNFAQLLLTLFFSLILGCNNASGDYTDKEKPRVNLNAAKDRGRQSFTFCRDNNFNTDFCILVDMSLHSGVKRFFVWNFKKQSIEHSFLVSHGCCDKPWKQDQSKKNPTFSNVDGSHCSSLGKYKIGARAYSNWGVNIKYFLHGLEATNNNAYKRIIVLHSWEAVSDEEVYPKGTPEGWGCPTLSNNSFKIIDPLLKASNKPVLMWVYN
jgi:hypothetical protein